MQSRIITNELIENFRLYLYEEEKSDNTIEKYMRDIRHFCEWLKGCEFDKSIMLEYKRELIENYAPASVNSMLSSLNALFIYLNWYDMKVKTLKIQKQIFASKDKELTKAEYERLLTAAKSKNNEQLYYLVQTIARSKNLLNKNYFCHQNKIWWQFFMLPIDSHFYELFVSFVQARLDNSF